MRLRSPPECAETDREGSNMKKGDAHMDVAFLHDFSVLKSEARLALLFFEETEANG